MSLKCNLEKVVKFLVKIALQLILGHNIFDTTRTDIGQLLYKLKYKANISKVAEIISLIKPFLLQWGIADKIDIILPIPSSKKDRAFQPVTEISRAISEVLGKTMYVDIMQNNSTIKSKDLSNTHYVLTMTKGKN